MTAIKTPLAMALGEITRSMGRAGLSAVLRGVLDPQLLTLVASTMYADEEPEVKWEKLPAAEKALWKSRAQSCVNVIIKMVTA